MRPLLWSVWHLVLGICSSGASADTAVSDPLTEGLLLDSRDSRLSKGHHRGSGREGWLLFLAFCCCGCVLLTSLFLAGPSTGAASGSSCTVSATEGRRLELQEEPCSSGQGRGSACASACFVVLLFITLLPGL